ncbi:MAG: HAD family phosphatase [Planctomycetota bacterium]
MIPFPSETQALLFDCDGTLVDSMPIHVECWQATLADYGIDLPKAFIDDRAGMPTNTIVEHINAEFAVSLAPPVITSEKEARYLARLPELQPIDTVLATARQHYGKLPMAVASGSVRHVVIESLQAVKALEMFPVLVTADDPVEAKPSPEIFLEAARQLGAEPTKCHVFEDGDHGINAARAAGMTWTDVRALV